MSHQALIYRHIARVVVECDSPLSIGSGERGWENENLIVTDVNGLPYIPGTSLAGVFRSALKSRLNPDQLTGIFGFQEKERGQGSRILFSSGLLLGKDGRSVVEGIHKDIYTDDYLSLFMQLPERDHVRINDKGVAEKHAKFLEQLVYTGTRFVFEIELRSLQNESYVFEKILRALRLPSFRLGSGTRNGLGALKIVHLEKISLDLTQKDHLQAYLQRSSSLNQNFFGEVKGLEEKEVPETSSQGENKEDPWEIYTLNIRAKDFFIFGSGTQEYLPGEGSWLDQVPKKEEVIRWEIGDRNPHLETSYLIPGTSLKGALAHRVAYHYNLLTKEYIENQANEREIEQILTLDIEQVIADIDPKIKADQMNINPDSEQWKNWISKIGSLSPDQSKTWQDYLDRLTVMESPENPKVQGPDKEKNEGVKALFGYAKDTNDEENKGARGKVIIHDFYIPPGEITEKIFTHVAIDRFTGGALDGALFEEQVCSSHMAIEIEIWVEKDAFTESTIKQAFEASLNDLVTGQLPLGGNTSKGHGIFVGSFSKKQLNASH